MKPLLQIPRFRDSKSIKWVVGPLILFTSDLKLDLPSEHATKGAPWDWGCC
jgi:hypothetical protein